MRLNSPQSNPEQIKAKAKAMASLKLQLTVGRGPDAAFVKDRNARQQGQPGSAESALLCFFAPAAAGGVSRTSGRARALRDS